MEWNKGMEGGGNLYIRDEGSYVYLEASRPRDQAGLYKIQIQGLEGKQILGTLTPSGDLLKLSRMVSRKHLDQWGCWPIQRAICQLSFPFQELPPPSLDEGQEKKAPEVQPAELASPDHGPYPQGFAPCGQPETWVKNPRILGQLEQVRGLLYRQDNPGATLALPYLPQEPFPLPALFCLCQLVFSEEDAGRTGVILPKGPGQQQWVDIKKERQGYLSFSFGPGGQPKLPVP